MHAIEIAKVRDFVSVEERRAMHALALDYLDQGILQANPRGPGRYRAKIWNTPHCTDMVHRIGGRIIERFSLQNCPVDQQLGWIISLLQPGAQIHPHLDKYPYHEAGNTKHLRCNVMVSRDNNSGNPVIGGNIVDVPERTLWCFFPSEVEHHSQVITTDAPRIVYQFGFTVPRDYTLADKKKVHRILPGSALC